MRIVFHANNSLDAHIVRGMLEMHGINTNISGELLQGGIGTLPAFGLVKVQVAEADYAAAREIIKQWEEN
jgi:hypothetical protein